MLLKFEIVKFSVCSGFKL